jgi:hypothetical protein
MGGSSKTSNQNQTQFTNQTTTSAPWQVAQPGLQKLVGFGSESG